MDSIPLSQEGFDSFLNKTVLQTFGQDAFFAKVVISLHKQVCKNAGEGKGNHSNKQNEKS